LFQVYKDSNLSAKTMLGAREKRVIYDSLSISGDSHEGADPNALNTEEKRTNAHSTNQKAFTKVCVVVLYVNINIT